uniref:Uncharacterized protein n=1 Tax=Arundo donax TaxID=35708 RepID=A0A0A9D3H4_ARUDO
MEEDLHSIRRTLPSHEDGKMNNRTFGKGVKT